MDRDLRLVTLSMFTWGMGEGMFIYFQPLYLRQLGADVATISAVLGGLGIAMTVAHIPAGYIADRLGQRPVMWASWLLGLVSTGVMALAASLPVFVAGMLVYGVTAFVAAPLNSYISGARGRWSLERALTLVSAMYSLGAVSGPLLGGEIAGRIGLHQVYLFSTILFAISAAIIFFVRNQPVQPRAAGGARPSLLRNGRFTGLLGLALVVMFATYLPQPLASIFLQDQRQVSLVAIGQLGSLGSLGNAILLLGVGRLSAPLGLILGQLALGLFSLLLWRGTGLAWYGLGYFFIGGYRMCRQMVLALARPLVHPAEVGLSYGLFETANGVAVILAPLAAGFLYERSPAWPFSIGLALTGLTLAASLVFLRARRQSEEVPAPTRAD